jgi:cytochrome P450
LKFYHGIMLKTAPGPKTWFPLKRIFAFQKDPIALLRKLASYGDVAQMRMALRVFIISDPELIRQVFLPLSDKLSKGRALERAKILMGDGLLTSEGALHTRQRRLIMPGFHRARISLYGSVMVELAAKLAQSWNDGQELDLRGEMMKLTLDIAGRTMFGAALESEAAEISAALTEVMDRFQLAILPGTMWLRHLPTPGNLRLKRALTRLNDVVYRMIRERREKPEDREDLLSMLLQAQDEENNNATMTDTQVRDEVMTLFLAGHETTANALSWTWVQLCQNPGIYDQLQAELKSVLGGRLPTPADYPALKYTEKVFSESMRLYPPAWIVGRRALEELELGGYRIPKGSIIVMSQYLMQRDPRFWTDPEKFDPERFSPEEKAKRPSFSYFPFGAGPRGCIGEGFAWMEGILVMATLAQSWRLELLADQNLQASPQFTLRPKGKIRVRLKSLE